MCFEDILFANELEKNSSISGTMGTAQRSKKETSGQERRKQVIELFGQPCTDKHILGALGNHSHHVFRDTS